MAQGDARWQAKQALYQDPAVVARYDEDRFAHGSGRRSTERKWRAIRAAMGTSFGALERVLDLPCGTGRFTGRLLDERKRVIAADRSLPMLSAAREKRGEASYVCADAERLPFADGAFDLVLSIRFLFHVPRERRVGVLREMARVSRRFVVVDVRHRYSFATITKRLRARLAGRPPPSLRYRWSEIEHDLRAAGLALEKRVWLAPGFSEKLLLFCRIDGDVAGPARSDRDARRP